MWTPYEQDAIREESKTLFALLGRTGEIFLHKPDVASERRNIMPYLSTVFPEVLPVLDQRVRQTWAYCGFGPNLICSPRSLPQLRLSTWGGRGRDGHPLVTAAVTRETLADLRLHALQLLQRQLQMLAHQSSLSDRLQSPPIVLSERVSHLATQLRERGQLLRQQFPDESWLQLVNFMLARLPLDHESWENGRALPSPSCSQGPAELLDDLWL